jgi:hypothetical protein
MQALSEKIVAALPVPEKGNKRYYFSGATLSGRVAPSGFNVCVTANGAVSFALYHRPHQETLGRWDKSPGGGDTTLIAGIIRAKERAAELAKGADPRPTRTRRIEEATAPKGETVSAVVDHYLDRMRKDSKDFRTLHQVEATLTRFVKPILGALPAHGLRRREVVDMLDRVADEATPLMSDRTLHHFRKCWRWACKRDDTLPSPFVAGMQRTDPEDYVRTRTLTDAELAAIWGATADGSPFSRYVRFLLLTGARRSEALLPWSELDAKGFWTLPASRNKVKFDLVRPLSKLALAQLVMNGESHAFSFSNGKLTRYHRVLLERSRTADLQLHNLRLHDLRRTTRTLLSRAKIPGGVAERCLGHKRPKIERTYDQHQFLAEMQSAYETLARLIEQIVDPKPNVVPLRVP